MTSSRSEAVAQVISQVSSWSPEERLMLVRRILQTLRSEVSLQPAQRKSLRDLLGLLKTEGPAPSDEECRRMLEEELLQEYGA